jgi:hypothetical protein
MATSAHPRERRHGICLTLAIHDSCFESRKDEMFHYGSEVIAFLAAAVMLDLIGFRGLTDHGGGRFLYTP